MPLLLGKQWAQRATPALRRSAIGLAIAAASATGVRPGLAAFVTWQGGSGNWSPGSWAPHIPGSFDQTFISNADAINRDIVMNITTSFSTLEIGNTGGGTTTLEQTSAVAIATSQEQYGWVNNAHAEYRQSNGTHSLTSGIFQLGPMPGSVGAYYLSGSGVLSTMGVSIGGDGAGTFVQTGGSHSDAGSMFIGSSTVAGLYNLQSGSLTALQLFLTSAGNFTQSGGSSQIASVTLFTGSSFSQTGGTFSSGTFGQGGGSATFSALTLGTGGSAMRYNLSGGTLNLSAPITINSGSTFNQTGGLITSGGTFHQTGGAVLFGGATSLYQIPELSISGGTTTFTADTSKLLMTGNLTVTGPGALDLTSNDLLYHSTAGTVNADFATFKSHLAAGRIYSSLASATTGLALMRSSDYLALYGAGATFDGQSLTPNDLLLKYTYLGDADFSGNIGINDYALLEAAFFFGNFDGVTKVASWVNGDFNGDGKVNYQDYAIIDASAQAQGATLAGDMIAKHRAEFGPNYLSALTTLEKASVPEPASLSLLFIATPLLLRRQRRSRPH